MIVRQTRAVDAALAVHGTGRLTIERSLRGMLGRAGVTVAAHPQLARALRDGDPVWLDEAARAALGVPEDLQACAVPIVVAAEPLGLLVLAAEAAEPLDADSRRLLRAISAAMGFALLRDRLWRSCARRRGSVAAGLARYRRRGGGASSPPVRATVRSRAIDWRMIRETCICETPMRSPISAWVRSSSKRSRSTSRSRGVTARMSCSSVARLSARPNPSSDVPTVSPSVSPASSSLPRGVDSEVAR